MIHGKSNDPVVVKKIYLRIWHLRDEIEEVLKLKMKELGRDLSEEEVSEIRSEYVLVKKEAQDKLHAVEETDSEAVVQTIQRLHEIIPEEKIISAFVLLSELNMNNAHIFSAGEFLIGQSIVLEFDVPKRFVINAQVTHSRLHNLKSRVISPKQKPYRISLDFTFLKPGERALLREFLISIEPEAASKSSTPTPETKKLGLAEGDEDSDKSDDFSDLDL